MSTQDPRPQRNTHIRWTLNHLVPYLIELATDENTLLALEPTNRIVPTTMTRITANITAYSAMSWPSSSRHTFKNKSNVLHLFRESARHELLVTARRLEDSRMSRS